MTAIEQPQVAKPERLLDPIARVSEILFGLIMALTFTGTLSAATAGREDVRTLLIGVIGCNIAWGLVDAVMFLMASLTERGHALATIRGVRAAGSPEEAHYILAGDVRPLIASIMTAQDFERLRRGLLTMGEFPRKPAITRDDWMGALAVFLLVFLSTFPVVIPFILFRNVHVALRTSNLVAIVMLFVTGYWLGQHGGYSPWRTGLSMVLLGVLLVGITIALGG